MLLHHLLLHVMYVLASGAPAPASSTPAPVVPNPAPMSPISGNGVNLILGYAKWGSLTACGASALVSGGALAVGHHSNRPDVADKGKRALLWSLGGAAVTGLAIPTLNTIIAAFH
jgi:hypothetical protein